MDGIVGEVDDLVHLIHAHLLVILNSRCDQERGQASLRSEVLESLQVEHIVQDNERPVSGNE